MPVGWEGRLDRLEELPTRRSLSRVLGQRRTRAGVAESPHHVLEAGAAGQVVAGVAQAVTGELPVGEAWAFEVKWDGIRVVAAVGDARGPVGLDTTLVTS